MSSISAVIEAKDLASKTIKGINSALTQVGTTLAGVGNTKGLGDLTSGISTLSNSAKDAATSITRIVPVLSILTSAASVAGIGALGAKFADLGVNIGNQARYTKQSVEGYQGMVNAGRLLGASTESMSAGLAGLATNLQDAVGGRNADVAMTLNAWHIGFHKSATEASNVSEVLPQVFDKLRKIKDPVLQLSYATQFFGGSAADMIKVLNQGSNAFEDATAEAKRHGFVTREGIANYIAFQHASTGLQESVEGVGHSIASNLNPAFTALFTAISKVIDDNRPAINRFLKEVGDGISSWVKDGGVQKTVESIEHMGKTVKGVIEDFGGWNSAAVALGIVLTASIAGPLATIAGTIRGLSALLLDNPLLMTMLLSGDTAKNPEAMAAQHDLVGDQTRQYYRQHPEADPQSSSFVPERQRAGIWDRMRGQGGDLPSAAMPNPSQHRAGMAMMQQLIGLGETPAMAAAAAGGSFAESGLNGSKINPDDNGSPSKGAFQWHADRIGIIEAHLGKPIEKATLAEQTEAYHWELKNRYSALYNRMQNAPSIAEASRLHTTEFEVPANKFAVARQRIPLAESFGPDDFPRIQTQPLTEGFKAPAVMPKTPSGDQPVAAAPATNSKVEVGVTINGAPQGSTASVTNHNPSAVSHTEPVFNYAHGY